MDIKTTETAEVLTVTIEGDVELLSIAMSKNQLMKIARDTKKDIELNLAEVNYIDSSGIGLLISMHKLQSEKGKKLKLINLNQRVKEIIRLTSVDNIFNI